MNMKFRKVASVLTSAVMLASTVGIAAAANYPAPFVKSGMADVAVVWGSAAQASDLVAVTDITADLQAELASQTATTGGSSSSSSVSGGDSVQLERSTDRFNLGDSTDDFYSSLDDEELSAVLADGVYQNDDNNEFDFTQKLELGILNLTHFQDNEFNDEKPAIGFDLPSGLQVLNYTLDFSPDAAEGGSNFDDLETTELTMLGRTYYVVQAQNVSGAPKITLLDSANSAIITEGESSTVSVGATDYEVGITFIDSDETILTVDGTTTNKLQEGDVFKIAQDTYVAVKNILYSAKDGELSKAEISIGSGKIVLENGQEVEINNEEVSDIEEYDDAVLQTFITNTGENIDKIVLTWKTGDDTWLTTGSELALPGFETIKLSMGAFNVPAKEMTTLENDGEDSIKLSTTVEDGDVDVNLLFGNGSLISGIGRDTDELLLTTFGSQVNDTDVQGSSNYFVASWVNGDEAESYVLEVSDITDTDPAKNTTTVKSLASDLSETIDVGSYEDFGRVRLTLNAAEETMDFATLSISAASGSGAVNFSRLYTKEGLRVQLPVNSTTALAGAVNLTYNGTAAAANGTFTFVVQFREEDEDGNIESSTASAGQRFNATIGLNGDGEMQVSSIGEATFSGANSFETDDGTDEFVGYVSSPLATKVSFKTSGDQDTLEVEYHGEEAFADVFVSEAGTVLTTDGSDTTSGGDVKKLGSVAVSDAEASSVATKNLIVVGGSCVNSVAADLLGGALCGANFESKTGAGSGQFVIETFARSGGKVATLVAGYNAGDTTNAAKYLTTQTVDTAVGKKYVGTSATSAQLVTQASNSSA
jgi:hypothetical protein